jgi:hypothetical protein
MAVILGDSVKSNRVFKMKFMQHLKLILILVMVLPTWSQVPNPASGSADTIYLGIELHLGMSKESVVPAVARYFRIQKVEDTSTWVVSDKNIPSQYYGMLTFEQDKLVGIQREWQSTADTEYGLGTAIYRAGVNFTKEHRRECLLDAVASERPGGTLKTVSFICGAKTLAINIADYQIKGKNYQTAEVTESLR